MNASKQILIWLTGIFSLYICYLLIPVFTPFLIASLLAYLSNPLVILLEKRKLSRTLAVCLVFALIILVLTILILILAPLLVDQLIALINKIPAQIEWLQTIFIPKIKQLLQVDSFALDSSKIAETIKDSMNMVSNVASQILSIIGNSSSKLIGIMVNLMLIPMLTFYLMRDWNFLAKKIHNLLPKNIEAKVCALADESNDMLGSFLRGQLSVMLALALIYSLGLSIVGLEIGLLIGVIAGLVSFVPYLGFSIGILMAVIAAWFQFHDLKHIIMVCGVFGFGQICESFFLTPKLVGEKLGMHPVAVIFALMAGGQLFGFFGILLALPSCAVLMVLLKHAYAWYQQTDFYLKSDILPKNISTPVRKNKR
ncbi:AI-2E family transporter [Gammaproteobacteria bacterium]|nr:AI-2E family transporter [Gammaproteobacteria bacterium]